MASLGRTGSFLGVVLLLAGVWGCSSTGPESGSIGPVVAGPEPLLQDSWMYAVAADQSLLKPFESGAVGDAWLTLYHNDLVRAVDLFAKGCKPSTAPLAERSGDGFACVGLVRSHLALAEFYAEAAALDRVALRQFHLHRAAKADEVLPSIHSDYFYGVVLVASGDRTGGVALLEGYAGSAAADPFLGALARRISGGLASGDGLIERLWGSGVNEQPKSDGLGELPTSEPTRNYVARLVFMEAVARGDLERAEAVRRPIRADQPDLKEELEPGGLASNAAVQPVILHNDPGYLVALSRFHALSALVATGGAADLAILGAQADRLLGRAPVLPDQVAALPDGLSLVLFSGLPTPADLLARERSGPIGRATLPRLSALESTFGLAPTTSRADLDPFVEGVNRVTIRLGELIGALGREAAGLNNDMQLTECFRGQLLRERARHYQAGFDVRLDQETGADIATAGVAARTLLELAYDKSPSPPNPALKAAWISNRNDPPFLLALARAELDTRRPYEANGYVRPLTGLFPELVPVRDALTILDTAWNPPRAGAVQK